MHLCDPQGDISKPRSGDLFRVYNSKCNEKEMVRANDQMLNPCVVKLRPGNRSEELKMANALISRLNWGSWPKYTVARKCLTFFTKTPPPNLVICWNTTRFPTLRRIIVKWPCTSWRHHLTRRVWPRFAVKRVTAWRVPREPKERDQNKKPPAIYLTGTQHLKRGSEKRHNDGERVRDR